MYIILMKHQVLFLCIYCGLTYSEHFPKCHNFLLTPWPMTLTNKKKAIYYDVYSQFISFLIIVSLMPQQCLNMHGQVIYGDSPVVSILGISRCFCYGHTQGYKVFLYAGCTTFFGLPFCLMPCTTPRSVIFRYLLSFILKKLLKYLKYCCYIL